MNLKQALAIFWSRRLTILLVFAATFVSAFIAVSMIAPQYIARGQLFINLSEPNVATNNTVPGAVVRNYINTQVEAMRSRGTAVAVAISEGLVNDPATIRAFQAATQNMASPEAADIADWIAAGLQRSLEVNRIGASDVIQVNFKSENPVAAARFTNAFLDVFVRRDIELRSGPTQEIIRWHEDRLKSLRERYTEAETQRSLLRLEAIRRGDADAAGAVDPMTSLTTVVANARNAVIQARSALELARSGQNPPPDNPEVLQLRRAWSDVDLNLRRETPLLGPTHRRIQALRTNADQLQSQLDAALKRLRADIIADRERELTAAERRLEDATRVLSRDESQRNDTSRSRAQAAALDRELESLKGQIDAFVQRRERALMESTVSVGNVSVLSRAAPPAGPSFPRVPLVLAVAAGIGLAFGFALAFLREMLDRRVRCADDLSVYFDAPLLGHIHGSRLSSSLAKMPALPLRAGLASRERTRMIQSPEPLEA